MLARGREIFYKLTKSTEKNVFEFEIRKLTAECKIRPWSILVVTSMFLCLLFLVSLLHEINH